LGYLLTRIGLVAYKDGNGTEPGFGFDADTVAFLHEVTATSSALGARPNQVVGENEASWGGL
jgi:hypothetical protein